MAFDLNATSLTQGFVAPNSAEMATAIEKLNRRTPLGSCDLGAALDAAVKSFASDSKSPRAIVYIGDGSSRARMLTVEELNRVVGDLVSHRTPVIAFGVGPQIQRQLLGILAARTGGVVVPELSNVDADAYGAGLARAVHGSVLWPTAPVKWPGAMTVYAKTCPPLRSDRDTVVVGTTKSTGPAQVEIAVDGPAGPQTLKWDIPQWTPDDHNSYLATLVKQAEADDQTLPLINRASLANAKQEIEAGGRGLAALARDALGGGNLAVAGTLADAALKRDPNDQDAKDVKDAVKNAAAKQPARQPGAALANGVGKAGDNVVGGGHHVDMVGDINLTGDNNGIAPEGAAVGQEIAEAKQQEIIVKQGVGKALNDARRLVAVDPAKAEIMIQNKITELSSTDNSELRQEFRDGELRKLGDGSGGQASQGRIHPSRAGADSARDAETRAANGRRCAFVQGQKKVKQLMDRFDSLMAEGRHHLAEESAAFEAEKVVRRSQPDAQPMIVTAAHDAQFVGDYDNIMAVRVAAQKGFLDCLYTTEKSHVPVADDPPIIYPDAEIWRELTAHRKEKYTSASLSQSSPTEKKIEEALKQPTSIEFVETPLKERRQLSQGPAPHRDSA